MTTGGGGSESGYLFVPQLALDQEDSLPIW